MLSNSKYFGPRSVVIRESPVMFPPGRARLAAKPLLIGSPTAAVTMGIVVVARRSASTGGVPSVTMTSGLAFTSSAASAGRRS